MNRRAFTLIELAVVLLILAIIAAAVAVNVRSPMLRARERDVVRQLQHFDRMTRTTARQLDEAVTLVVDLSRQQLRRTNGEATEDLGRSLQLPRGGRITAVRLAGRTVRSDTAAITCSRQGLMQTYALELSLTHSRRRWLMFTGLTGQCMELDDADALEKIFATFVDGPDAT